MAGDAEIPNGRRLYVRILTEGAPIYHSAYRILVIGMFLGCIGIGKLLTDIK